MQQLPVTREIHATFSAGRGRVLILAGFAGLVALAVIYQDAWHVFAALAWACSLMWFKRTVLFADRAGLRLPIPWQRLLEAVSIPVALLGVFATFATVALRASRLWAVLSLVGVLFLLWDFFVRVLVFKRQALLTVFEIGTLWALLLVVAPHVSSLRVIETTGVLCAFFLLTVRAFVPRFKRISSQWAPWHGSHYSPQPRSESPDGAGQEKS